MAFARSLPTLLLAALAPAQVALRDLPALARARAERLRPVQEAALQPFWQDFTLDYRPNVEHLDKRIHEAARLGDGVVPLLLEKLQPVQSSPTARNVAANCRRVLELLDPASFIDALVEMAASGNEIARGEAVRLLGHAQSPRAAQVLTDMLDQASPDDRMQIVVALTRLKAPGAAAKIAPMLGSPDRNVREAVLDYLTAAAPASAIDLALQALQAETDGHLLMEYVDYFAAAATDNDTVAKALLPLLDHERLVYDDKKRLVQALAKVAPKNHDPTIRRLQAVIDGGELDSLGLQAALALRALGDKSGLKKLQAALTERTHKPTLRRDPKVYEERANLFLAIENYTAAADDLEKVLELSQNSLTTRRAHLSLARCEAHRKGWTKVLDNLREAGPTWDELAALAQEDPALQEALQTDKIRPFVQGLREQKDKAK
jgi:hypothetical protein